MITVSYDGEADDFDKTLPIASPDISPYASHTGGLEWKEQIKKNNIVDCMHKSYNWIKSTISEVKEFTEGKSNRSVPKVFVCYRIYHENKETNGNDINSFNGLGTIADEWLNLYSLRIQQEGLLSKKGIIKIFKPDDLPEKPEFYDYTDILLNSVRNKEIFAIVRTVSAKSELVVRLLNNFGKENGFQKILQKISSKEKIIPLGK